MTRTNRQEIIPGWNQSVLENSMIIFNGLSLAGEYALLNCAALGFGGIAVLEDSYKPCFSGSLTNFADMLRSINPHLMIGLFARTEWKFGEKGNISLDFSSNGQGHIEALIDGTLKADYARKTLLPLESEAVSSIAYAPVSNSVHISGKVYVAGAGALGNFVVPALAVSGLEVFLFDGDTIEETNLNRQPWLYDAVGQNKAEVLAERINSVLGKELVHPVPHYVDDSIMGWPRADVVVSCVDNFGARAILNRYCVAAGIPLVNGGTSALNGQATAYQPGITDCLDCQLHVEEKKDREASSCLSARKEPSVVTANAVTAGFMADMALAILQQIPVSGKLVFDSASPQLWYRAPISGKREGCAC